MKVRELMKRLEDLDGYLDVEIAMFFLVNDLIQSVEISPIDDVVRIGGIAEINTRCQYYPGGKEKPY